MGVGMGDWTGQDQRQETDPRKKRYAATYCPWCPGMEYIHTLLYFLSVAMIISFILPDTHLFFCFVLFFFGGWERVGEGERARGKV